MEQVVLLIKGHVEPGFVIGEVVVPLMVSLAGHVRHLAGNGLYFLHENGPSETVKAQPYQRLKATDCDQANYKAEHLDLEAPSSWHHLLLAHIIVQVVHIPLVLGLAVWPYHL